MLFLSFPRKHSVRENMGHLGSFSIRTSVTRVLHGGKWVEFRRWRTDENTEIEKDLKITHPEGPLISQLWSRHTGHMAEESVPVK